MKILSIFLLVNASIFSEAFSQDGEDTWFDFWVGSWEVTWTEADGSIGKGTNTVTKILDNTVIQENFKAEEGAMKGYRGTSLSVYNPRKGTWHQGYADNQGAYFNFVGERQGDKRIFSTGSPLDKTEMMTQGEKQIIQRMVFYDIAENSLMWDWESSEDGGKTWKLNWRIHYRRISG